MGEDHFYDKPRLPETGQLMLLEGRNALITGASRGIGRTIALALAEEGADISFTYHRNRKAAEQTAAAIRAEGRRAFMSRVNLADIEDIGRLFQELANTLG